MGQTVAVIPARGGSKGIPRKNIKLLHGKPLIAHSIEQALNSLSVNRTIVTTDDQEIADVARKYGAEVPFLRPKNLAEDKTPDLPVYKHLLEWLEKNESYRPSYLVILRPTCPVRAPNLIDLAVNKLKTNSADSVRTGYNIGHVHPYWMLKLEDGDRAKPFLEGFSAETHYQRQMLPPLYRHNGVVDVVKAENILNAAGERPNAMYGKDMRLLLMPEHSFVNIDTEFDFKLAELMMGQQPAHL